jgi:hypothetical protein
VIMSSTPFAAAASLTKRDKKKAKYEYTADQILPRISCDEKAESLTNE